MLSLNKYAIVDMWHDLKLEIASSMKTVKHILELSLTGKKEVQDFENVLRSDSTRPRKKQYTRPRKEHVKIGEWYQLFLDFTSTKSRKEEEFENRLME